MVVPPLHPTVLHYLRKLQATTVVGMEQFLRRDIETSPRTAYRWHRSLGAQLLIIPGVSVEALGLLHAHAFVTRPGPAWFSCPYAVEASWGTPDLCGDVLYVHCLVPASGQRHAARLLQRLPCVSARIVWSGSGVQHFIGPQDTITLPVPTIPDEAGELLRKHPFIIPAIAESWQYPNSMPMIWARALDRLEKDVRWYVRERRVDLVNGKRYVRAAFDTLARHKLVYQHIIRYHPLLLANAELFVSAHLDAEQLGAALTALRAHLRAIETYPTSGGYFCRLLGPHELIDAIMHLRADWRANMTLHCFHAKRSPIPVTFRYDRLFDPKTATWKTPGWHGGRPG